MGRPSGPLIRCSNRWTEARYKSFIMSLLRSGTRRWAPISEVKKEARVERGKYKCACCGKIIPTTVTVNGKRVNNIIVDHIKPIVDPTTGFTTWNSIIENMFCEKDNLQVICYECHTLKSNKERELAAIRRQQ